MTIEKDWPAAKVTLWSIDKIKPYPNNPRTHSDEQIDFIAASMREDGVSAPILVDENGVIIYGHGRRLAALKNGFKKYPVSVARGWTDEQKAKVRITDNQFAALSGWDEALLAGELQVLADGGIEMPTLGFSREQLQGWGFDVADAEMPTLSNADRPLFQQMTFTLHDSQVETVKAAIEIAKAAGAFNGPNENSNGNALARICEAYTAGLQPEGNQDRANQPVSRKRAGRKGALQRKIRQK